MPADYLGSQVSMESNMHADELRMAVTKIVDALNKADIRSVVDQYRSARGDKRTAAAARLGHAGAILIERIGSMSATERMVAKCLHLESLGSTDYWRELLGNHDDPRKQQAEIVRLASRVMFAGNHLPAMISLLSPIKGNFVENTFQAPVEPDEGRLSICLTDAGERASDPDRVARSIDGIDMLYSACASITQKPVIDLRLDSVVSKRNNDRNLHFTGERDAVAAVFAVIDSIPTALAEINPEEDIDLDAVIQSLPIFYDLNTLATLGTFSQKDLKDISETMRQGALMTLESGVILIDPPLQPVAQVAQSASNASRITHKANPVQEHHVLTGEAPSHASDRVVSRQQESSSSTASKVREAAASDRDEHYDRYLRERAAMQAPQSPRAGADTLNADDIPVLNVSQADEAVRSEDQIRRDAVEELLKSLGQARSS